MTQAGAVFADQLHADPHDALVPVDTQTLDGGRTGGSRAIGHDKLVIFPGQGIDSHEEIGAVEHEGHIRALHHHADETLLFWVEYETTHLTDASNLVLFTPFRNGAIVQGLC